jgi:hypothetical protein
MTPTLTGRWQTRTALLATLGLIVTAIFWVVDLGGPFFLVLLYVFIFGLVWDIVYILLQKFRWDRDWPTCFQIGVAVTEGILIYALISTTGLPGIKPGSVPLGLFVAQYGLVWLATFLWVQGPMRLVTLCWRFHGGRFV